MKKPICVELFAGLHGWGEAFAEEGYEVWAFDIVDMAVQLGIRRHRPKDIHLVLQDVATLHGRQFKDAAVIVASPPCQAYSARGMPWARLRDQMQLERMNWEDDGGPAFKQCTNDAIDNSLFRHCFRIQREASEAAGRQIPLIVENVKAAQPWVGRASWHFGSYFLWGDVPALMPITKAAKFGGARGDDWIAHHNTAAFNAKVGVKVPGQDWGRHARTGETTPHWRMQGDAGAKFNPDRKVQAHRGGAVPAGVGKTSWFHGNTKHQERGQKTEGHVNRRDGADHTRHLTNQAESEVVKGLGGSWFGVSHGKQLPKNGANPTRGNNEFATAEGLKGPGGDWFKDGRQPRGSSRKGSRGKHGSIPEPRR